MISNTKFYTYFL